MAGKYNIVNTLAQFQKELKESCSCIYVCVHIRMFALLAVTCFHSFITTNVWQLILLWSFIHPRQFFGQDNCIDYVCSLLSTAFKPITSVTGAFLLHMAVLPCVLKSRSSGGSSGRVSRLLFPAVPFISRRWQILNFFQDKRADFHSV